MGQPAWDEMKSVGRAVKRSATASTEWPPSSSKRLLVVRPLAACETAMDCNEVMRKSRSSSSRSDFGTSRIAAKLDTPRASHPHTCLRRYAGASCSASHASSAEAERDRIGGRGSMTRLLYRRFVDVSA